MGLAAAAAAASFPGPWPAMSLSPRKRAGVAAPLAAPLVIQKPTPSRGDSTNNHVLACAVFRCAHLRTPCLNVQVHGERVRQMPSKFRQNAVNCSS